MGKAQIQKIGPFECVVVNPRIAGPTVVLFHGYGANMQDLAPLSQAVQLEKECRWVFPNGVLDVPIGPGFFGKGWYPLSAEAIQRMNEGRPLDLTNRVPDNLKDVRDKAKKFLMELSSVEDQPLFLGGFSQGGMVAVDLALSSEISLAGMILLSTVLINKQEWSEAIKTKEPVSFFQSHGIQDLVLEISGARKLNGFLTSSGWKGSLLEFSGGHEIPPEALQGVVGFMNLQLDSSRVE